MIALVIGAVSMIGTLAAAAYGIYQGRLERARKRLPGPFGGLHVRSTKTTDGGVARIYDGERAGRAVHLRCLQPLKGERTWRLQMGLRRALPDGVSLGAGPILQPWGLDSLQLRLDDGPWGRLICTGDNPRKLLSALLATPPAVAIPTGRERFVVAAYSDDDTLTIGLQGAHEELVLSWLDDYGRLLTELERVVEAPFREASERSGLRLGFGDGAGPRLKGWSREVAVEVWIDEQLDTRIEAAFHHPGLPEDLVVMHKDRLAGNVDLDDPVLGMLVSARCSEPEVLSEVLGREGVSEALLEVVHAHPGSRVIGGRVELVARRVLADDLADAVEAVVTLAAGLKA